MDPLTHFSAGVIIGSQFSNGPALPLFCGFIAVINDLDFVFKWSGNKRLYFLHHKAFHSLFAAVVLAFLTAIPVSFLFRIDFFSSILLCTLVYLSHIILDLLVAGGDITLLYPLNTKLYSLPLFPGLTPKIKFALCEKKSPFICGLCQTEVFIRSLFRLSLVIIAFAVLLERAIIWLALFPALLITAKILFRQMILRHLRKEYNVPLHIIPVSSFPLLWNAAFYHNNTLHIKKFSVNIINICEIDSITLPANEIIDEYNHILKRDKNISSFMESHPILYAEKYNFDNKSVIDISDPRFSYNDGNRYFLYRIILDKGEIVESEFREKWSYKNGNKRYSK